MDWKSASEIVAGKILSGEIPVDSVNPDVLMPPYRDMAIMSREGKDKTAMVLAGIPYTALEAAETASQTVGESKVGWLKVLDQAASLSINGVRLRKQADKMERGDMPDTAEILHAVTALENGYHDMMPMNKIDPSTNCWIKTGYEPVDKYIGGIPDASLTILGASPGVGKTTLALRLLLSMVRAHKNKSAALFSLEMTMGQIAMRALELDKKITKAEKERILLSEEVIDPKEIYAIASRTAASTPLSLIAIDFADLMVPENKEQSESIMGVIYRTTAKLAKKTGVPVLLISQLNRETYVGGLPKINHLRYSGLAEAMSALILLLYNPHNLFADFKDQQRLPSIPGIGYIIEGKARFGFKSGGPGAVQVDWDGLAGWGDKARGWTALDV